MYNCKLDNRNVILSKMELVNNGYVPVITTCYNLWTADHGLYGLTNGRITRSFFTIEVDDGTITFTDHSTGYPYIWDWDFGDGSTSHERNPIHIYETANIYTATLTVVGRYGTASHSLEIDLSRPGYILIDSNGFIEIDNSSYILVG